MLLKEQKAKFSFLASDEEDEEDRKEEKRRGREGAEHRGSASREHEQEGGNGEKDHRKKGERDRDGHRGRKRGKGEGKKSPTVLSAGTQPSSTYSPHVLPPEEPPPQVSVTATEALQQESSQAGSADTGVRTGAHTPPFNGQTQVR